ncbi:MAG: nucleotide sugar dehydrogenase [Solirubrobacteraceae bacterium]|jgi:nucleotide sugar dehydrogenase
MDSQVLLEAPASEKDGRIAQAWPDESEWATAASGARITRATVPSEPLVAVVGLSHTGLPSAIALRRAGFRIVGIDTSSSRLNDIRSGRADLLGVRAEDLRDRLSDEGFVLTDKLETVGTAEMVLICVPTTIDAHGHPNLEALRRTCATVVQHARSGQTLVLTSTTYVGATRELLTQPLGERGLCVGEDVFVAFSPECVSSGARVEGSSPTPRIVGAVSETCFRRASELLRPISSDLHRVSSPAAAEMAKLYESTFRAVNIALAFEMADACRAQALDPVEVTDAAATRSSGFMAHYPSAGVGGHGVGVDPHYLLHSLRERGCPAQLAEDALRIVAARPHRVAMRAHELLLRSGRSLRELRVLVVGVAYKPGVADCANAPAVEIISRLLADNVRVDFHDPLVPVLYVDGEEMQGVDPDPRRDASGFGPEDYELAIVVGLQPGHDYGWLGRCPQVLDCTYRERTGRRHFLL